MVNGLNEAENKWIEEYFDLSEGQEHPLAFWIIGRSAAGKTTTGKLLHDMLSRAGHRVELIDGDALRSVLDGSHGYSLTDRLTVFKKYVHINQLLQDRGIIPITATLGGLRQFREIVRNNIENPRFIYLDCSFDVAAQRDQKGLYAKALAGEMKNFFGVDIPYEVPVKYEMKINSADLNPSEIVKRIVNRCIDKGLLKKTTS